MEAAWNGSLQVVKILVDRGADIDAMDNNHKTALMLAYDRDNLEIAKVLKTHRVKDKVGLDEGFKDREMKLSFIFSFIW